MTRSELLLIGSIVLTQCACSRRAIEHEDTGQKRSTLKTAKEVLSQAQLRDEGWKLFEEVTATDAVSGLPRWRTWRQKNEVLNNGSVKPPGGLTLRVPAEFLAVAAEGGSATADPSGDARLTYESTHFNDAADVHIQKLVKDEQTDTLLQLNRREVSEFPKTAVVVKAFWRKMESATNSQNVGIWDWSKPQTVGGYYNTYEELWLQQACISLKTLPDCLTVSDKTFHVATVKDISDYGCTGCPDLQLGDTLVLVAMHIMAKTRQDWFWATFWWKGEQYRHLKGDSWTCDNAQRPAEIANAPPWNNYSMDVIASFKPTKEKLDPSDPCGAPPPITRDLELSAGFNPFIEGRFAEGRHSTCINCHSRARTVSGGFPRFFIGDSIRTDLYPGLKEFEGHIRTDYVWSIAAALEKQ